MTQPFQSYDRFYGTDHDRLVCDDRPVFDGNKHPVQYHWDVIDGGLLLCEKYVEDVQVGRVFAARCSVVLDAITTLFWACCPSVRSDS